MTEENKNRTYSFRASEKYLSKQECVNKAEEILENDYIRGMTKRELYSEIYFHAWAYHISDLLEKKDIHLLSWVKKSADPIDLADNGDTLFRKLVFSLFWLFPQKHYKGEDSDI